MSYSNKGNGLCKSEVIIAFGGVIVTILIFVFVQRSVKNVLASIFISSIFIVLLDIFVTSCLTLVKQVKKVKAEKREKSKSAIDKKESLDSECEFLNKRFGKDAYADNLLSARNLILELDVTSFKKDYRAKFAQVKLSLNDLLDVIQKQPQQYPQTSSVFNVYLKEVVALANNEEANSQKVLEVLDNFIAFISNVEKDINANKNLEAEILIRSLNQKFTNGGM